MPCILDFSEELQFGQCGIDRLGAFEACDSDCLDKLQSGFLQVLPEGGLIPVVHRLEAVVSTHVEVALFLRGHQQSLTRERIWAYCG